MSCCDRVTCPSSSQMFVRVRRTELGSGTYWLVPSDRRENVAISWELACTKALCYFSFRSFRKTSVSSRAKRALENERGARERNLYTIALAVNKSPAVYILSPGLDGLWRENRGSVNRLCRNPITNNFREQSHFPTRQHWAKDGLILERFGDLFYTAVCTDLIKFFLTQKLELSCQVHQ